MGAAAFFLWRSDGIAFIYWGSCCDDKGGEEGNMRWCRWDWPTGKQLQRSRLPYHLWICTIFLWFVVVVQQRPKAFEGSTDGEAADREDRQKEVTKKKKTFSIRIDWRLSFDCVHIHHFKFCSIAVNRRRQTWRRSQELAFVSVDVAKTSLSSPSNWLLAGIKCGVFFGTLCSSINESRWSC